ncbi:MAG TPA: nickel pincer cofactor biosynthesis protein LarC [Methanomicrobiales archaeon]|nr:nickel pincer cofactor biosynthesis protein LarC [Methanomicrobiales archaeon]
MRILLFDPFHGASGDMITAALLHLGADREAVRRAMASVVKEPGIEEVERGGIRALRVRTGAEVHPRSWEEVRSRLSAADAPAPALALAERVMGRLHRAEGAVHGGVVHFHEVGADDAIADIVGACTALHNLHAGQVAVLPVAFGRGLVRGSHGVLPVPAPATAAILSGSELEGYPGPDEGELLTPTGAALLAEFSTLPSSRIPPGKILAVGYGAGSRETGDVPNLLRAFLLETADLAADRVEILETNVDDVSPEVIAYTISRLMTAGARDASAIPSVMKKGRSGHLIRVIAEPALTGPLALILAEELGTLGIRVIPTVHRLVLGRRVIRVPFSVGDGTREIEVKIGSAGEKVTSVKPEFEQARNIAGELGVPVREVLRRAEEAAREIVSREGGRGG